MSKKRIALRLPPQDRDLLDRLCEARSESISNFVRRAIRAELARLGFYPENVRRALGLENVVVVSTGKKREDGGASQRRSRTRSIDRSIDRR